MNNNKLSKLLQKHKDFEEFKDADKIISYLQDPDHETEIPKKLQIKLDQYKLIHSLRMRYKKHSQIVNKLKVYYTLNTRQAQTLVADAEYVFGKVLRIDRDFEKAFLIEMSRQSIQHAMASKNSDKISRALITHKELLGEEDDSDLPDFSEFEPRQYTIQLPKGLPEQLMELFQSGAIDLSKAIPSKMLNLAKDAEDVDIKEEQSNGEV